MKNEIQIDENQSLKQKNSFFSKMKFQKKEINTKEQIFKIVLTGLLLGLSVALSLIEIFVPILGAYVPLRIFDSLIMAISIPIVGLWYTLSIAIIEPWLHFAIHSDHPPIQMVFDNIANVIFVLSFVLIFYKLFKLDNRGNMGTKAFITKNTFAGLIIVPLNAIVSSLAFAVTLLVLNSSSLSKPDEYVEAIESFLKQAPAIFFILLVVEIARFLVIYVLFALVQKKLGQLNRFQTNAN